MRRFAVNVVTVVSLVLAPLSPTFAAPAAQAEEQALAARIDALITPHFPATGPGVAVIVTKDGKTVFRKGYGRADVASGTALRADAPARIGSMTKQFTAVAILMLADEGKLALSDDITSFLPVHHPLGQIAMGPLHAIGVGGRDIAILAAGDISGGALRPAVRLAIGVVIHLRDGIGIAPIEVGTACQRQHGQQQGDAGRRDGTGERTYRHTEIHRFGVGRLCGPAFDPK